MRIRRVFLVACCVVVTLLSGCKSQSTSARVVVDAPSTSTTMQTPHTKTISQAERHWYAAVARRDAEAVWYMVARARENAAAVKQQVRTEQVVRHNNLPSPPAAPSNLADVMQCIKNYESGDYNEHSHTSDGSGAYQFIPGTWRAWSERAGYGGYSYAYQAPPSVQDSVLLYTLTHGGAGNWSNRYGYDPCTQGMGG